LGEMKEWKGDLFRGGGGLLVEKGRDPEILEMCKEKPKQREGATKQEGVKKLDPAFREK